MNDSTPIKESVLMASADELVNMHTEYLAAQIEIREKEQHLAAASAADVWWKRLLHAAKRELMKRPPWMTALILFLIGCFIVLGPMGLYDTAYNKFDREHAHWTDFVAKHSDTKLSDIDIDPEMTEMVRKRYHKYKILIGNSTNWYMVKLFWYTAFEWFWIAAYWCFVHWILSMLFLTMVTLLYYIFQPQIHLIVRMPFNLMFPKKNKVE